VRLQVKGKNVEVSHALRWYAGEKLGKLGRHLSDSAQLELELAVERNPSIGANQIAEGTIWMKGAVVRARESSPDMRASIDLLAAKLERQLKRSRERRRQGAGRSVKRAASPTRVIEDDAEPAIVKTKHFAVKPMAPEEAVLQLELVGHDFFVFRNAESDDVNIVYRRRDGKYGLIEPAVA
jgi:ribosome hibernation promoting factor